jgi:hypothetical protein
MIQYKEIKVTAKVKAKHIISDELMKVFDTLKIDPKSIVDDWDVMTTKEQEAVKDHVSLFEDRIHKLLGVKFKEIISASNFSKSI